MASNSYTEFLAAKQPTPRDAGFAPLWLPEFLFNFQKDLVDWSIRKGRAAVFADCGLGKTPMQLVWAENVVRKTNGNVLILTPLAVAEQTLREAGKFGIGAKRSRDGKAYRGITVTNYHRLDRFDPKDFTGIVCDESSILKSFQGKYRRLITKFMGKLPYRLLCTATPAPNDFVELGTSSEALGVLSRNHMLRAFFIADDDPVGNIQSTHHYRLKGHAHKQFWQWIGSWARAVRKPSDLGYDDGLFILPPLYITLHKVRSQVHHGFLPRLASTLSEQRAEKRQSLDLRCHRVAELLPPDRSGLVWCQLNREGNLLASLLPGAVEVAGSDADEVKEERLNAFSLGQIRILVSKPSICSWGMNWQHCADVAYFPTHSHEQYYQAIRRCWRFGQQNPVTVNLIYSEAEGNVLSNMLRKEKDSDVLYQGIVREMSAVTRTTKVQVNGHTSVGVPTWLSK